MVSAFLRYSVKLVGYCCLSLVLFAYGCGSQGITGSSTTDLNVICEMGAKSGKGYRTKKVRTKVSGIEDYNKVFGVATLDENSRKKYEICYDKVSKKLVRRNSSDLTKFETFDTNELDTIPYSKDYRVATPVQVKARKDNNCKEEDDKDKGKWKDPKESVYHTATFAMDDRGRIYASTVFEKCVFHHSSYLSGAPVAAAGEMRVDKGTLKSINNESGHYRPPDWTLRNIFDELETRGMDTSGVACTVNPHSKSNPPGSPANCS